MAVHIRRAGAGDLGAMRRLVGELAAAHVSVDPTRYTAFETAWAEYARAVEGGAPERPLLWLVAEDGGHVIGYLMAEHLEADDLAWSPEYVCVHDLMLETTARRGGAGRALMDAAAAWARERGVRQLRLFTDERNEAARGAFGRMGFRRTMVEMTRDL